MANTTKFRVQAGALVFEMEGPRAFVQKQVELHRDRIETILDEQARIIKGGKPAEPAKKPGRRGRPPKNAGAKQSAAPKRGRRPGRQPSIIRESSLTLRAPQIRQASDRLAELAGGSRLGKDASVFGIAYFLCKEVLKSDTFTAGDVIRAYQQIGATTSAPPAASVDVVQMLRNLAASSIGKEWVARNPDGTFSLTAKGNSVGESGSVVRPRGRRPMGNATKKSAKKAAKGARRGRKPGRKPGRPAGARGPGRPRLKPGPKPAATTAKRGPGRPKATAQRGPGRPPKSAAAPVAKRGPGRPPKTAAANAGPAAAPKKRGRPRKNPM